MQGQEETEEDFVPPNTRPTDGGRPGNTDIMFNEYVQPRFKQNVFPREYVPDYRLDDYYSDVERQRGRKRPHPGFDYYGDGINRLAYMGTSDDMTSPDFQKKNRNRNKAFDTLSRQYGEARPDTIADNRYQGIRPQAKGHRFREPHEKFGNSEFGVAQGTRPTPSSISKSRGSKYKCMTVTHNTVVVKWLP